MMMLMVALMIGCQFNDESNNDKCCSSFVEKRDYDGDDSDVAVVYLLMMFTYGDYTYCCW